MDTILITGGTGLIATRLSKILAKRNYKIILLARKHTHKNEFPVFLWNPSSEEIEEQAIRSADYIIHLAGAGIGDKRWTDKRKKIIQESRIKTTLLLSKKVISSGSGLKAFISASAIGYYGSETTDRIYTEEDQPANDFLAQTCLEWEKASDRFEAAGIRTVKIRTGIVLSGKNGALSKMTIPVKLGIGSALGKGSQFIPWIHIDDLCNIYVKALEDQNMKGAFNAVAPEPVTNRKFLSTVAETLGKPFFFPDIPEFLIKMILGERSSIILEGNRISCDKIIKSGFQFEFPLIENALRDLLNNT
jgi:uncharacterized protein (TIGR01777 family)